MWHEYPDEEDVYDIFTQFMFGEALLVAPKLTHTETAKVTYYLPTGEKWYNWISGQVAYHTGWQTANLTDLEQAVFVKGGTIIPILEHDGCLALLSCIKHSVNLTIYLDVENKAEGSMYIDDY